MRALLLLLLVGCDAPDDSGEGIVDTDCEPVWQGTQIGEPDCRDENEVQVSLRDADGQPVAGSVTWSWNASCPPTTGEQDCATGDCSLWDVPPGTLELEATDGTRTATATVQLDDADAVACDTCCDTVLIEAIAIVLAD